MYYVRVWGVLVRVLVWMCVDVHTVPITLFSDRVECVYALCLHACLTLAVNTVYTAVDN